MFYITGDTHGSIESLKTFKGTSEDTLIITGDFGFVWSGDYKDDFWLDWLEDRPYRIFFCDGNHENFTVLFTYPEVEICGGKAHQLRKNIYHLIRGEVFNFDGATCFVLGGAVSLDKHRRLLNQSWWAAEEPNYQEIENGLKNLDNVNWQVDFVITHDLPNSVFAETTGWDGPVKRTLEKFREQLNFDIWYAGHYHRDILFADRYQILYNVIIPLGETFKGTV